MIKTPYFFSDGALFQADSRFVLSGECEPGVRVSCAVIDKSGNEVFSSYAESDSSGGFSVEVKTPSPSFDEYTLRLVCGSEVKEICGVLFGEVWLASGQSNMELTNEMIVDCGKLFDSIEGKRIRVFHVDYPAEGCDFHFPYEPDRNVYGFWVSPGERERLRGVSAVGLKFAAELYDSLNRDRDIPVGVLSSSWGGSGITAWLPKEYIDRDDKMIEILRRYDLYPERGSWNTRGGNFNQTSALFNYKIGPLLGLRCRGVIWYQGENECWSDFERKAYADYLRLYHRAYSELFGCGESFMMLSSLIYPWAYTNESDCLLGHLNSAFVDTAIENPDKFAFMPIGDLEPVWGYHANNHPIHPTHKYEVGRRLARLAMVNVYGAEGQKSPAYLVGHCAQGNKMRLKFGSVGDGLYVGDRNPRRRAHCLYGAGEDGIYLPAEYRIISPDTLEVWCDGVDEIKNVCYACQSLDVKCNIFAGEYPVAPFSTDRETRLIIEPHRWYDSSEELCWGNKMHGDLDIFYHPMWHPLEGSEVCHDTAFCYDTTSSVRVCSDEKVFGCYVLSYPYARLDLFRFSALEADFYNADKLTPTLVTVDEAGNECEIPFKKIGGEHDGWARYSASLAEVKEGYSKKMIFRFEDTGDNYHFANIERVRLIK